MLKGVVKSALGLALIGQSVVGLDVQIKDDQSIKSAAGTVAYGLMKYYTGNNTGDTPGNLPNPYYWWEAGAMFGTIIDYWHLTGDSSYNDATMQAILHQAGDKRDFMPLNQTRTEGNDDQGFWAMAAMSAAENKFPDPPSEKAQYLAMVQAVFNQYVLRWDPEDCGGGMRWQIFQFNNGWDYKNSISNGCFFNIAARLARYTGNSTYSDWATKIFEWEQKVGLITKDFGVHDGIHIDVDKSCKHVDQIEWSYNAGILLHGAAAMYNLTEKDEWKRAVDGLLKHGLAKFLKDGVVHEQFCEFNKVCNNDQQSFKGYFLRWLSSTAQLYPGTYNTIKPVLEKAGQAAAGACSGTKGDPDFKGTPGTACGFSWIPQGKFDGMVGVGEQMNALSALMYNLVAKSKPPVTEKAGGTSKGDPSAGSEGTFDPTKLEPMTTGDKVGAGILTTLILVGVVGGTTFMLVDFRR